MMKYVDDHYSGALGAVLRTLKHISCCNLSQIESMICELIYRCMYITNIIDYEAVNTLMLVELHSIIFS